MNNWPTIKLGEVVTHRKEFIEIDDLQTYKRCRVQLHVKGIVLRDEIEGALIKTKQQQVCRTNEFLVAEIDAKVGGYGIVPSELNGAIVSSHYFLFTIDELKLEPQFLGYYIKTPFFRDQVSAQGTTNYAAIRPQHVLNYTIPLLPLSEQRRIVAKIEQLAAKIEETNRLRIEAAKESDVLLNSAISKVFSDIDSINPIPLVSLTSKIGSGSTPSGGRATYPSSGIPFIRSLNVRMREFQWDRIVYIDKATHETMRGTKVKPNDVLLNITGASIGRVACVPFDLIDANVNQHVTIIRPLELLNSRYLMYWLSQPSVQEFINNEQKGATRQGFTKTQIEQLKIPLCDLDDQRRIVAYLDGLQAQVDRLKALQAQTAAELEALLPSILDKAFKGEL